MMDRISSLKFYENPLRNNTRYAILETYYVDGRTDRVWTSIKFYRYISGRDEPWLYRADGFWADDTALGKERAIELINVEFPIDRF